VSKPMIEACGIDKTFTLRRDGRLVEHRALKTVSADLHEGEILGIVGESGSGKTTLSRIMIGIDTASKGEILFHGDRVATRREWRDLRRHVQYVFQDPFTALCPTMRIGKALAEPLAIHGIGSREERPARVARMLEMVGLHPDMAGRLPSQLSGGQRQRVNLARALMSEPKVLICDEIVSGLDVSVQAQVLALLLDLQKRLGLSLIFISHDLRVIRYLCDRVLVMYLGEIVEQGRTDEVFAAPKHDYTRRLLAAIPDRDRPAHHSPIDEALK